MSGNEDVSPFWVVVVIGRLVLAGYLTVKWTGRQGTGAAAPKQSRDVVVRGDCDGGQRAAAQGFIAAHGYSCDTLDFCSQSVFGKAVRVTCNGNYYVYTLEDHGGKWSVVAR